MSPTVRIAPAESPFDPLVSNEIEKLRPPDGPPLTLFTTLARNPRVLSRIFAGGLLDRGSITLRQRELVILRTCALNGAAYEWGVHVALFAGKAELSKEEIETLTLRGSEAATWAADERLVLELAEALHVRADVGDALWARLRESFSEAQLIELIALGGFYRTISSFVNALRLAPERYAPPMPRP